MIQVSIEVLKPLPKDKIERWQDKVVYGMARATLDFTSSKQHFPYLTGELQKGSMATGVVTINKKTYGLDYDRTTTTYAPRVWQYGEGTNWTNKSTLPQWYISVFDRYTNEIVDVAIKNAESELE